MMSLISTDAGRGGPFLGLSHLTATVGLPILFRRGCDPFTGQPYQWSLQYPLERFIGRILCHFWETAGGQEDWRQWMQSTGWTGLSEIQKNPYTGEDIKPYERQWLNRWIGENGNWDKEMEQYMNWDEGKFEKAWRSLPGHKRAQLPIGKTYVHQWLDESKKRQFNNAWAAFIEDPQIKVSS